MAVREDSCVLDVATKLPGTMPQEFDDLPSFRLRQRDLAN
jgi:hypothetical protein